MAVRPGAVPSELPSAVGVVTLRGSSGAGRRPPQPSAAPGFVTLFRSRHRDRL